MPQQSNVGQALRSQQLGPSDAGLNTPFHPLIGLKLASSTPKNNDSGFDENLTQTGSCPFQQNYSADSCFQHPDPDSENRQPLSRHHHQKEQVGYRFPEPLTFATPPSASNGPFHFDMSIPFIVPPPALLLSTPVLQSIPLLSPTGFYWPSLTPQPTAGRWSTLGSPGQSSVAPRVYD
ncbi:unnamed protein product, partial [Dibothriocephalus latus]